MKFFYVFLLMVVSSWGAHAALFETDIEAAYQLAKKTQKPMLIDFYGIWCPPCNQLDETVFETPTFVQKAKRFVLLKVDVDKENSWKIKSRYKVGGYPTVVFTDSKGEEIYRIVGYRGPQEFFRIMDMIQTVKTKGVEQACKSKREDDLFRCLMIARERQDKPGALRALAALEKKKLNTESPEYFLARTYAVELSESDDLKRAGFEKLMESYPANPAAMGWALEYLGLFNHSGLKPRVDLMEKTTSHYSEALQSPIREALGVPRTDLAQMRAELLGKLGKHEEAKVAWKEAADMLGNLAAELPAEVSRRGFNIERIGCLESAGDLPAAMALVNEYRAKYPKEFTFHYMAASMLHRAKKFNESLPIAKQAYENSYGDNRIRAATLLVNLYATVPNKAQAKEVYDTVVKDIKPGEKLEIRTHRYLKILDDAWQKVEVTG